MKIVLLKDFITFIFKTKMNKILIDKKGNVTGNLKFSQEDELLLSKFKMYIHKSGYPVTKILGKKCLVHRIIMGCYANEIIVGIDKVVDHINGDKLDCTRQNLRFLSRKGNAENRGKCKKQTSSIYKGVSMRKNGKFRAVIKINKQEKRIGTFDDEVIAAKAYDTFIVQYNILNTDKIYHRLNFPHDLENYVNLECVKNTTQKNEYIGVSCVKNRFRVILTHKNKKYNIGYFSSEKEAAKAYDSFVVINNFDKKLNFPEENLEYFPDKDIKTTYEITTDPNVVRIILKNAPESYALIDFDDYDKIKFSNCYMRLTEDNKEYVCYGDALSLHRLVTNAEEGVLIDHINSNGLDNRKYNLRLSDFEKNAQNRKKSINKSSQYLGVSKSGKKWKSYVTNNHKLYIIGTFDSEENAAKARDEYIVKKFPDSHYKMNFNEVYQ